MLYVFSGFPKCGLNAGGLRLLTQLEELGDLEAFQGVAKFPVRVKCATLAWHTLEDGLKQREQGGHAARHEE